MMLLKQFIQDIQKKQADLLAGMTSQPWTPRKFGVVVKLANHHQLNRQEQAQRPAAQLPWA